MSQFKLAKRIEKLPPYLFAEIDRVKNEVKARGVDIISLGIGDPDLPTPEFIIDALYEGAKNPANHQYPSYNGMPTFRLAVADWYKERFGVTLDASKEIVSLIGSKEGIAHFPIAFVDPGDTVIICSPNYPVPAIASMFMGGNVVEAHMTAETGWLPDLDGISDELWEKAKIIFMNFPGNPTSAVANRAFYEKLVKKAKETNTIIVHDAAYTEIYFDPANKPMSILEVEGAKDVAIEFHSLSKTYNMTGWRVAMAVGNQQLVGALGQVKENVDSGIFQAVQEAGAAALKHGEPYAEKNRAIYKERLDVVIPALKKIGVEIEPPSATFFVWAPVPQGYASSKAFVTRVLEETGVVITPGNGFGTTGEGYFRLSLTVGTERLEEAVARIASLG